MAPESPAAELVSARARTRAIADDLGGARELGPLLAIVNPPRWEIGHVGWFQEYWCLRRAAPGRYAPERSASILPNADALYNSATVPHDTRWSLPLPDFAATLRYRDEVLECVLERLARGSDEDEEYFARLAARHEDMHAEAFHYTRQTLAYDAPRIAARAHPAGAPLAGDAEIPGGVLELGAAPGGEFVFDNEKWAHPVVVAPFRISRTAVTNAEYRAFVAAGGPPPEHWRLVDGAWLERRFDRWQPPVDDEPVIHVSWQAAVAYCAFAGRRLPTEAEWEFAATWDPRSGRKRRHPWGDDPWRPGLANLENATRASVHAYPGGDSPWGVRQMIGNVWEWTARPFLPYPGFLRDPYKEYSEPWFGNHMVLRGGCFSTSPRIARATYRNFYTPERGDVFAGLRTCAADA
jgi:iron(II)-dependent oxidoreductase